MHENEIGTLIVEEKVIVELKSVEKVQPAHKKQVLTYLCLTGMKLGSNRSRGRGLAYFPGEFARGASSCQEIVQRGS